MYLLKIAVFEGTIISMLSRSHGFLAEEKKMQSMSLPLYQFLDF